MQALFVLQTSGNFLRQHLDFGHHTGKDFISELAACLGELHGKQVAGDQLCTVCLGGSHCDLRTRQRVEHMVSLPRNRAAHHIDNGKRAYAAGLGLPQGCQTVRRLATLTDNDDKRILGQQRFTVTELRRQFGTHRDTSQIFKHILCHCPHMVGTAAGHHCDLLNAANNLIRQPCLRQINFVFFHYRIDGIRDRFRLLMDLLHHKMLEPALLSGFSIPVYLGQLLLDDIAIQIIEGYLPLFQTGHLVVANVIHLTGVFEDGGNVRRHIGFLVLHADDHRAILARHPNLFRVIFEQQRQCVGAADAYHCLRNCIHRPDVVLFIVVIYQLNGNFGICLRVECITFPGQFVTQFLIVLDDTVMYTDHVAIIAAMGVGIGFGRFPVGSPAGMSDAAGTFQGLTAVGLFCQHT